MRAAARTWLVWWVVLFWLWLAFAGEWNRIEWVAAAIAATAAATIAEIVRGQHQLRFRFRAAWLRELARVPLQILIDFFLVIAALPSRREGVFRARPAEGRGDSALAAGRRAWLTLAATYSPNAYVLDLDAEDGTVLVHDLVPNRRSEEPA
jgi:hypothetical protein